MEKKRGYVIAVAGSGGKTTLIEQLSRHWMEMGKKVLVTTTTHMRLPKQYSAVGKTPEEAAKQMERDGIIYYGKMAEEKGKMEFPGQEAYDVLCGRADYILVEADGSRRLPMKVPDWSREPVIPGNADEMIVVFGLSALGRTLEEACHRWQLGAGWVLSGQCLITHELAVDFLEKGYLAPLRFQFPHLRLLTLLNQADGKAGRDAGEEMKARLEERGFESQVVQLKQVKLSLLYLASGFGTRFGRNKLLEPIDGKRMFEYGLETLLKLKEYLEGEMGMEARLIVVSQYPEILDFGRERGIRTVENPYAAEGITASIRLGTEAAGEDSDYYLYAVADQPWLKWETLAGMLRRFLPLSYSELASIGCLACDGRRGNPGIFHKQFREELLALKGDKGGSQIMKRYPDAVMEYPADSKELQDMDTPAVMQPDYPLGSLLSSGQRV